MGTDDEERWRRTIDLLWRARPAGARGPKAALDVHRVARAGGAVADAEGLGAVTMQRVAEGLGVTKMALYRYVPGKTALVALMVDQCLGEPPSLAPVPGGWRPRLDAWSRSLLQLFSRHRWALEATVGPRPTGPNEMRWLEEALVALSDTGLEGDEMLDVVVTLIGHVRNIAQQASERDLDTAFAEILTERADSYPGVVAAMRSARESGSQDQALDFGLRCILDGVQSRITGG